MVIRSKDPDDLLRVINFNPGFVTEEFDIEKWVGNENNRMYVHGKDVGLATYEYEGLYNVHWFFEEARGRAAIRLAQAMLKELFTDSSAKIVRGVTRADLKAARWLARQVGLTSHGFLELPEGFNEIFFMTKEELFRKIGE
jgi:hypothetical protein